MAFGSGLNHPQTLVAQDLQAIGDCVLVVDMEFGNRMVGGVIIPDDDGKERGIRPRWARVWRTGPKQKDVHPGEWVLVSHGRWSRAVDFVEENAKLKIRRVDPDDILLSTDSKPY